MTGVDVPLLRFIIEAIFERHDSSRRTVYNLK